MKEFKMELWCGSNFLAPLTEEAKKSFKEVMNCGVISQQVEVIIRIPDQRQDWIDKWFHRACLSGADIHHCKDVTYIIQHYTGYYKQASSAPRHGDKYDRKTGIAVAYAKLCKEPIPEYI